MNNLASHAPTPNTEKPSLSMDKLSGSRKIKDILANFTITAGGMGVLAAILLIFFYLLYEIFPLFDSAELTEKASYQLEQPITGQTLYTGMEEQAEIAIQLDDTGLIQFFRAETGQTVDQFKLNIDSSTTAFALNSEQQQLMGLAHDGGSVSLLKPAYKISYPNDKRLITPIIEFPYGEIPIKLADETITSLAIRDSEEELVLVAEAGGEIIGRRYVKEEDFLTEEMVLEEEAINLPEVSISPDWLLVGPDQRWLYVISKSGNYQVFDIRQEQLVAAGNLTNNSKITSARFLLGGISLLVGDANGEISQWFIVRESGKPARLEKIRTFNSGEESSVELLAIEHRRKGFLSVDNNNELGIYYTTSSRNVLTQQLNPDVESPSFISQIAISPRANAVLSQTKEGQFTYWALDNEHPEVSWSALWEEIWYESYSEPDYIWQSSAANTDFEPKYSFTPLAFGTLKAAFYAMLIATPLAICGAIYTAFFMTPSIRRKVKPLIELMEALPTVILGFLAGLWLAPFIERTLPGVFSIFILLPIGVLLFGFIWSQLPRRIRLKVPDGWHAILLIPVVILIVWGSVSASGFMELWLFDGDMRSWLTNDLGISFDQRNALVVGIAMGFAVIPTIFSIAEDAIFSVPKSLSYGSLALGATPWQTLVGVVIPTASPGIFSALMIGMGRAVGETMIVLMATGNTPVMDVNIFEGMRTLAANIAVEIGETEVDSSHYRVLFLAAFVLFLFTFFVNTAAEIVRQRLRKKYGSL